MKKAVKALSIILICWCSLMIVLYLGVIVLNDIEWAPPGWLWMLINSASYLLYGGILVDGSYGRMPRHSFDSVH